MIQKKLLCLLSSAQVFEGHPFIVEAGVSVGGKDVKQVRIFPMVKYIKHRERSTFHRECSTLSPETDCVNTIHCASNVRSKGPIRMHLYLHLISGER